MKSHLTDQSRRKFLRDSIITGALLPLISGNVFSMSNAPSPDRLKIHIFSKHLQFLNYRELAEAAAEMGFDGVDLTVRPGGHVLPDRIADDLPKAAEALQKAGLAPSLMTTAISDATDATDKKVLETAAALGFKNYRMNWYDYPAGQTIPDSLEQLAQKVKGLSYLNKELGITGYYQNHAGLLIGSSVWEIWQLIKDADKEHMGVQYDIRHAVVEGFSSWQNGLRLVQSSIKTFALKDFKWKQSNGKWEVQDVPFGEGLVDFKSYFKLLKQYNINVPVSMHVEYSLGGAEHGNRKITIDRKDVFKAMKKDLTKIQELWQQA